MTAKVTIGSLDDVRLEVTAQYNPKELAIERSVPWTEHKAVKADKAYIEYACGDGRSMSLELFFDSYEGGGSVQTNISDLTRMSMVRDPSSTKEEYLRPHRVVVAWGSSGADYMPAFRGVIESLSTKYTMFDPRGKPVRATCTVKIKEAANLRGGKGK